MTADGYGVFLLGACNEMFWNWWWWLYDFVNILKATGFYTLKVLYYGVWIILKKIFKFLKRRSVSWPAYLIEMDLSSIFSRLAAYILPKWASLAANCEIRFNWMLYMSLNAWPFCLAVFHSLQFFILAFCQLLIQVKL